MKRYIRYISEIILASFFIFISYFAWDRIDVEAYEKFITQYTLEDVDVNVESKFNLLAYVSSENSIESSILSVNNYQDRKYNVNILLELNDVSDEIVDNLILVVDGNYYNLREIIDYKSDDNYYFLITNVSLMEYEKKSYNLKLLVNDDYEFSNTTNFSYNILEEIV